MLAIKIGLIGAGRMATALRAVSWRAKLRPPECLLASDPRQRRADAFAARGAGSEVVAARTAPNSKRAMS